MLTWLWYIDGIHVSIYSSTMDPMGESYSASIWAKKNDTAKSLEWCLDYRELFPNHRAIQVSELLSRWIQIIPDPCYSDFCWQRPRRVSSAPNVVDFYRSWSCSLAVGCARHAIWWKAPDRREFTMEIYRDFSPYFTNESSRIYIDGLSYSLQYFFYLQQWKNSYNASRVRWNEAFFKHQNSRKNHPKAGDFSQQCRRWCGFRVGQRGQPGGLPGVGRQRGGRSRLPGFGMRWSAAWVGSPCEAGQPWFFFRRWIPSGELTFCHGKSPFLMGKSTISMAIFNCYVSSPEGMWMGGWWG